MFAPHIALTTSIKYTLPSLSCTTSAGHKHSLHTPFSSHTRA